MATASELAIKNDVFLGSPAAGPSPSIDHTASRIFKVGVTSEKTFARIFAKSFSVGVFMIEVNLIAIHFIMAILRL